MSDYTPEQQRFADEVADKIGVVFNGCHSTPLERAVHRKQCEEFLVALHIEALAAKDQEIARLTAEIAHIEGERVVWRDCAVSLDQKVRLVAEITRDSERWRFAKDKRRAIRRALDLTGEAQP